MDKGKKIRIHYNDGRNKLKIFISVVHNILQGNLFIFFFKYIQTIIINLND